MTASSATTPSPSRSSGIRPTPAATVAGWASQPGPGVGGHCIAVDPWFIVDAAPAEARLLRTAREVNDSKPHHVFAQVRAARIQGWASTRKRWLLLQPLRRMA